jgi:hypothetical protein
MMDRGTVWNVEFHANKFVKLVHLVGFITKETGCHVCTVVIIQMTIVWETCQLCIISIFPAPNHLSNHLNQVQSSWRWRYCAPLKCKNKHATQYVDQEEHYWGKCHVLWQKVPNFGSLFEMMEMGKVHGTFEYGPPSMSTRQVNWSH